MERGQILPFVVGQKAEAWSFVRGFRSSWFRCEIKHIGRRSGHISAFVDYFDFTEQKPLWLTLYQDAPYGRKSKNRKKTLMLRPEYPVIYPEALVTDVNSTEEVVLVVNGPWKVGDMVDWFNSGCYWSGIVTERVGTDKALVELIPPPAGEGGIYEVSVKDLRPSLEWSVESGWTVPISKDRGESCCCARLICPIQQEYASMNYLDKERSHSGISSTKRQADECSLNASDATTSVGKSMSHVRESTDRVPNESCSDWSTGKVSDENQSFEEFKGSSKDTISGNSTVGTNTLEAAVLGLEELVNKVKWLKRILKGGIPLSESNSPSWELVEHRGSIEHKRT